MKRLFTRISAVFDGAAVADDDAGRTNTTGADADGVAAPLAAAEPQGQRTPELLLKTGLRLPRRLDLTFDRNLVGEGWHDCETIGHLPFRWMGRTENATIWIAVDRSVALTCDLSIYLFIDPSFGNQIGVAVGEPPESIAHERTPEGLAFVLPPAPNEFGATKITLRAPGIVPGPDPRRLAIACSHLRVRPLDPSITESGQLGLRATLSRHLPDRDAAARAAAAGRCEVQCVE